MSAVAEKFTAKALANPGQPTLLVSERVRLPCRCAVYIGVRLDNQEPATAAVPCARGHLRLMTHFSLLLRESLVEPQDRPLRDVIAELLDEAQRHAR